MTCTKCGKTCADSARFCCHCGAELPKAQPVPTYHAEETAHVEPTAVPASSAESAAAAATATIEAETATETAQIMRDEAADVCPETDANNEPIPEESTPEKTTAYTPASQNIPETESGVKNAPETAKLPKKPVKTVPIGLRILSAFLCIILFTLAASASLVGIARNLLHDDVLISAAADLKLSEITVDEEPLAKMIYDSCDAGKREHYNLTEKDIGKLLDEVDTESALENLAAPYLDYILGKTSEFPEITPKDIIREVKRNEKTVYKVLNYQITDADYVVMERELDDALRDVDIEKMVNDAIPRSARIAVHYIGAAYIALIALSVIFGFLVLVCNRMKLHEASQHLSITFFVCTLLFGVMYGGLLGYFITDGGIGAVIQPIMTPSLIRAGGYLFAAVLFLVICIVTGKRRRSKKMQNA